MPDCRIQVEIGAQGKEKRVMSEVNSFIVEHVSPSVIKERSSSGDMVIFEIEDSGRQTLADWASAVEDELQRWPSGYPCLFLHDLHRSGILAFGTDMQADFERLFHLRPELKRYAAVVMPPNDSVDIARLDCMLRKLKEAHNYPVTWEIFTKRKQALRWLYMQAMT
jgi:hypothetical protein